jgi:alcohol dehydrogenase class IV
MTAQLPPNLTASTGMDAMTHAVESYVSQQRNPISDAVALHAVRLIAKYLPLAVGNGSDLSARGQMQIAALLAGWAFSNAMVGLVHAMAHSLGAVCGIPHGLANGLLLPHVMKFNLKEVPDLLGDVACAMGVDTKGMDTLQAGEAAVNGMRALCRKIGLSQRLRDLGVGVDKLKECSELSLTDGSIIHNPKVIMETEEVFSVYEEAF